MRCLLVVFPLVMAFGQSSDPKQLLAEAKRLVEQPEKARDALPLLRQANQLWQADSSSDAAYADSLDLYVLLLRSTQRSDWPEWIAEAQPLAGRAVEIYSSQSTTPVDVMALALEIQADLLGRQEAGADAWRRAAALRAQSVMSLPFNVEMPGFDRAARIGSGAQPPILDSRKEPEYTAAARFVKLNGLVQLSVVIDTDGIPKQIRLTRGCGYGLDEKAAEAVSSWRFRPGIKEEQPVPVIANIEVHFKILGTGSPSQASPLQQTPPTLSAGPVQIGEAAAEASLIHRVEPEYPALAKQARISGMVSLRIVIGKEGTVESVQVERGHPLLVKAAVDAVRQWTYRPTLLEGLPVDALTTVHVPFLAPQQ